MTHNLRLWSGGRGPIDAPEHPESAAFRNWFLDRTVEHDWPALFDYRTRAPHAAHMHPTDEHLLPFYVAAGAAGTQDAPAARVHASVTWGHLAMDVYAFGTGGQALADASLATTAG